MDPEDSTHVLISFLMVAAIFPWLNEERWDRPERIRSVLP